MIALSIRSVLPFSFVIEALKIGLHVVRMLSCICLLLRLRGWYSSWKKTWFFFSELLFFFFEDVLSIEDSFLPASMKSGSICLRV